MLLTNLHSSLSNLLKNLPAMYIRLSGMRAGSLMISMLSWATLTRSLPDFSAQ